MSNILLLIGSKRLHGNTTQLADAFARGAAERGHHINRVHLGEKSINGCLGCNQCYRAGRPCAQRDDMDEVYAAFEQADAIALATPLYFWTLTASLKAVIERLYAVASLTNYVLPHKDCALLATAVDTYDRTFDQLVAYYQNVLIRELGWTDRGMLLVGGCENEKASPISLPERGAQSARQMGLEWS